MGKPKKKSRIPIIILMVSVTVYAVAAALIAATPLLNSDSDVEMTIAWIGLSGVAVAISAFISFMAKKLKGKEYQG